MPAISVIMPVYNSDKFLRDAIDSVLQQTFTDFELILIDDGSKDGSGAICDRGQRCGCGQIWIPRAGDFFGRSP